MSVRPRIGVTAKEWELFMNVMPDLDVVIKKLYANFNKKDLPDYSKSYLLHLTFTQSELLQSLMFNPEVVVRLNTAFPEEVKKFAGTVKKAMYEKDKEVWDKFIESNYDLPEYPSITQSTAASTLQYIVAREKLTHFSDLWRTDKTFKMASYLLFCKLCNWLKWYRISFTAKEEDDINNTVWYDYSITIL